MIKVTLLGTSGKEPLAKRPLSAMICRYAGMNILVDVGEGTQAQIKGCGYSFKDIDYILVTHTHADHVLGLPGVLLAMQESGRSTDVTIIGPKGVRRFTSSALTLINIVNFRVNVVEITKDEYAHKVDRNFFIHAFKVDHSVTCYGYCLYLHRNGKFDVSKAIANGVPEFLYSDIVNSDHPVLYGGRSFTKNDVLGKKRRGIKVVYCTDTRPVDLIGKYCNDADLVILEGMYPDKTFLQQAIAKKHMIYSEAAAIAKQAQAKELWLTHFSPMNFAPVSGLSCAKELFSNTKIGKCGMTTTLEFRKEE